MAAAIYFIVITMLLTSFDDAFYKEADKVYESKRGEFFNRWLIN